MANNTTVLAQRIEKAIDAEITRRMGTISNPVLRASVQELLRDSVSEKILLAVSSTPPKAIDIATAVEQSMTELAQSVKSLKGTALKGSFKTAGTTNDNGGKTSDSGAKSTPRVRPTRTYSSGGKDGYGGK